MDNKKDMILSVAGLLIVLIGSIAVILMKWPAGLLLIIPSAIPHIIRICDLKKAKKKQH